MFYAHPQASRAPEPPACQSARLACGVGTLTNTTVMTGDTLFDNAIFWAKDRLKWLALADAPTPVLTRRQCLAKARLAEYKVIDYSISAELAAERAVLRADHQTAGACA